MGRPRHRPSSGDAWDEGEAGEGIERRVASSPSPQLDRFNFEDFLYDEVLPLAPEMQAAPWPPLYRPPTLPIYDGMSDPKQFLMSYEATVSSYGGDPPGPTLSSANNVHTPDTNNKKDNVPANYISSYTLRNDVTRRVKARGNKRSKCVWNANVHALWYNPQVQARSKVDQLKKLYQSVFK
ncbi:hypothetical protein ACJX0J_041512, partial [Zea mays]